MKQKILSFSLVFTLVVNPITTIFGGDAAKLRIVRTIVINPEGGRYEDPKLSPDGSMVVFRGRKGGLFIRNSDGTGPMITVLSPDKGTNQYIWSPDSKSIAYERSRIEGGKRWIDIMIFKATTKETTVLEKKIPPFGFTYWKKEGLEAKRGVVHVVQNNKERASIKAMNKIIDVSTGEHKKSDKPIVYYDQIDLKHFVIVEDGNGNMLSKTPGYILPIMSPTKDRFMATKGHTYVLNLRGEVLVDLGVADNEVWSEDGKLILYQIAEFGGWHKQAIVGSELYVINADGTGKNQLTHTHDILEMSPHCSNDILKITYYDDKTGIVYMAELEETQ